MTTQKKTSLQKNKIFGLLRRVVNEEITDRLHKELITLLKRNRKKHGIDYIVFSSLLSRASSEFKKIALFHMSLLSHKNQEIKDFYTNKFYMFIVHKMNTNDKFQQDLRNVENFYIQKYGYNLDTFFN
jgi:hypothetical protein